MLLSSSFGWREGEVKRELEADGEILEFFLSIDQNLRDDMVTLKESPYLAPDLLVLGFVYDLETGLLREVSLD